MTELCKNQIQYKFRVWQPEETDVLVGAFIKYEYVDGKWRSFTLTRSQGWREFQPYEVLASGDGLFSVSGVAIQQYPLSASKLAALDGVKWIEGQ